MKEHISKLEDLLDNAGLSLSGSYLIAHIPNSILLDEIEEQLRASLLAIGYIGKIRTYRKTDHLEFSISLNTNSWEKEARIHSTPEMYWNSSIHGTNAQTDFLILSENKLIAKHPLTEIINALIDWRLLISKIADHPTGTSYYIGTATRSGGVRKLNIADRPEFIDASKISNASESIKSTKELLLLLSNDDPLSSERTHILKNVLTELEDSSSASLTNYVIKNKTILERFNNHFELYIQGFSVSKALAEIEEKTLHYLDKTTAYVTSSQIQAFAIPGALIAIASLVQFSDFLSLALTVAGLFFVKQITVSANKLHADALDDLSIEANDSFDRFTALATDGPVKTKATRSLSRVSNLIKKSKKRLTKINKYCDYMIGIGLAYSILKIDYIKIHNFIKDL